MSLDSIFDYLGVRLNGEKAEGKATAINWVFSDVGQRYLTTLSNSALTYLADRASDGAVATVTLERDVLHRLILGEVAVDDGVQQGVIGIEGDPASVAEFFGLLDDFSPMFEIVEPKQEP
jgi:alkyl sulfatase BDS1-like metallo-beta-lactamase superfamily hydrolase